LANCEQAIALGANFASAYFNKALALQALERQEEALASYDHAISLQHDLAPAYNNRGAILAGLRRPKDALASYDRAIAIKPDYVEAYTNRGLLLHEMNRIAEAVESYDAAISFCSNDANAHYMRANALKDIGRFDEALASIEKAIALDSGLPYALGQRLVIKTRTCDWKELEQMSNEVLSAVARGSRASSPFPLLSLPCPLDLQRKCAEIFVKDLHPGRSKPAVVAAQHGESISCRRLRVAYLSGDFRTHPVAFLIAGVFEQHDRKRFEVYALSFGRTDGSEMRARLEKGVEHFIDVADKADIEVATLLRERNIDIAVDLMGFTKDRRTGIFALRAAPIQVNYLGYPATMGADYIDYLIADRIVIPDDQQAHYAEKIVYLPDTFQCNDSTRTVPDGTPSRSDVKLPAEGFVFCSFNNNYKITPRIFDVWMRLLNEIDGSVLWLVESNPSAARNLRREAEARGIAGERLVFAPRVANPAHLVRHRLADLFLDTLPFNAGATASDVLRAGLPLLSCIGESFVGRAAASLLKAIGLPEMVTHSLAEYEARALELARNPAQLAEIKAKLLRHLKTHPLFDTVRFTRHLETAYTRMVERNRSGEPPVSFAVEATPDQLETEQVGRVGSL
jgi:predicted O-linked N-acetylglucosamine transferase (SPINDLY family)